MLKTKIIFLSLFLIIISIINISPALAGADDRYECLDTCNMTKGQIKDGRTIKIGASKKDVWLRQAAQENCEGQNNAIGCQDNTNAMKNCCEILTDIEYQSTYGDYNVGDVLDRAIEISQKLLGIVGAIALLFFIIAGIKMIFAGGSQEKIGSARTMMVQTIIGLAIFLSAYLIIYFIQDTLIQEDIEDPNFKIEKEFKPIPK